MRQIKPPKIERPFVLVLEDDDGEDVMLELSGYQYAQLSAHFVEVMCKDCHKTTP